MIILNTHHRIVLSSSGWSLSEDFSNEMCCGEPAECGTGENKANWSRKCHALTLSQGDFNQKPSQCMTLNVAFTVGTKWTKWLSVISAIKQEIVYSVTLFRTVGCSSTYCTSGDTEVMSCFFTENLSKFNKIII